MDLSFLLTTITLAITIYAGVQWVNSAYIAPRKQAKAAGPGAPAVKNKRHISGFKQRSARSTRSEPLNAGSTQQEAKRESVQVQPSVQSSAAIAPATAAPGGTDSADGAFTLSQRELLQLGEAMNLYREGATVEQAVCRAFGVTKGGTAGWVRAKGLFDAATVAPGAAPAGTYAAPAAPVKRRRAAR